MKKLLLSFLIVGLISGVGYGVGRYLYQVGGVVTAKEDPVNQFDIDYSNGKALAPDLVVQPAQVLTAKTYPFVLGQTKTTDEQFRTAPLDLPAAIDSGGLITN